MNKSTITEILGSGNVVTTDDAHRLLLAIAKTAERSALAGKDREFCGAMMMLLELAEIEQRWNRHTAKGNDLAGPGVIRLCDVIKPKVSPRRRAA